MPSAHLTGSGSFYSWFPPSSHVGDWVVTIGGYHSAYNPPAHYPRNLQRLGLDFIVGDAVHVVGGAYVAVTPKCAMAGGSLHISVDVGPVSAYADIALDVFINFKPFYFVAEICVSVGVDCEVDLLFVSFHISISLGADLTLWGPDFWFFGFSIDFGDGLRDPPGISLTEFYQIVRTAGPDSTPPPGDTTSANNTYQAQHKYSIEAGIFPLAPKKTPSGTFPNTGATTEWQFLAGTLQIRIDCDFSLSLAYLVSGTGNNQIQPDVTSTLNPIFAFPMHNTVPIVSTIWISVFFFSGGAKELIDGFQAQLVLKQAPKDTWSMYVSDNDPLARISGGKRNKPTALQDGSDPTVDLCQGVSLFPPVAILSQSPVVDFDATAAMKEPIKPDNWNLPATAPTQSTLLSETFEPTVTDGPTQWADFAALWSSPTSTLTFSAWDANGAFSSATTFTKEEMRGDDILDSGMLGLLVQTLGWDQRDSGETVGGVVQPVLLPDPNHPGQTVQQRFEWQLVGAPPSVLAEELGYYFPSLPMVTVA